MTDDPLAAAARRVLRANDTGRWTVPSRARHPHQWSWDSAFVAIGLAALAWDRAAAEVDAILAARWREGMLPHVRYDTRRPTGSFPGPNRWPRAQAHVADSAVRTSGIASPPIVVTAALLVGRRQPDRERRLAFWRRTYRGLLGCLEHLATARRLPDSPLVAVVHPWERGWDGPPDGDGHLVLAELLDEADYDVATYREVSAFCVNDVLMDALWYRAARDLGEIAGELGEPAPFARGRLDEFAAAFEERHWDPELGVYVDWDCAAARRVATPTAAGVAALAGGLIGVGRARAAWERHRDLASDREPVRAPVSWLVAGGLDGCAMPGEAARVRAETLDLVRRAGFAECFDPVSGAARGAGECSATAAVTIDLLDQEASASRRSSSGGSAMVPGVRE